MSSKPFHKLDHAMRQAREMAVARGELACVYLVCGKYAARPKRKALAAMAKHAGVSIVPATTYDEKGELCPEVTP